MRAAHRTSSDESMSSHSRYDRKEQREKEDWVTVGSQNLVYREISLGRVVYVRVPVTKIHVTHDMTGMVEVSAPSSKPLGSWVYGFV